LNGAIVIPPFVWQLTEHKVAVPSRPLNELVETAPMTIAVNMIDDDMASCPTVIGLAVVARTRASGEIVAHHGWGSSSPIRIDHVHRDGHRPRFDQFVNAAKGNRDFVLG